MDHSGNFVENAAVVLLAAELYLACGFTAALELHRRALLVDGGDEPALADTLRHLG